MRLFLNMDLAVFYKNTKLVSKNSWLATHRSAGRESWVKFVCCLKHLCNPLILYQTVLVSSQLTIKTASVIKQHNTYICLLKPQTLKPDTKGKLLHAV